MNDRLTTIEERQDLMENCIIEQDSKYDIMAEKLVEYHVLLNEKKLEIANLKEVKGELLKERLMD